MRPPQRNSWAAALLAGTAPRLAGWHLCCTGWSCGLTVERAIVVNDHMCTVDDPNVYAVSECAQHRGQVYGLVTSIWDQAKVLADHITERDPNEDIH